MVIGKDWDDLLCDTGRTDTFGDDRYLQSTEIITSPFSDPGQKWCNHFFECAMINIIDFLEINHPVWFDDQVTAAVKIPFRGMF